MGLHEGSDFSFFMAWLLRAVIERLMSFSKEKSSKKTRHGVAGRSSKVP